MQDRKERRLTLLLNGAIATFEEVAPTMISALDEDLLEAFDLIGSALHWMSKELKEPEHLPQHSGNTRTDNR